MHLKTLTQPKRMLEILLMKTYWLFPDKIYLRLLFRLKMGYRLDLKNPKTFSEKIQWLKLYNRRPEYTKMVDKASVKDYVANIIGHEYIIPTIGVWNTPDEIDFEHLPNQFVLKTTHGGGSSGVVICKDKTRFDTNAARKIMAKSMKQDIWHVLKEWPYKDVKPRIIAETYMESSPDVSDLIDYKWYCFNGEPKYCQVIQDRKKKETIDFFDPQWNHQDFVGLNPAAGHAAVVPSRPKNLDIQIEIARKLAQGMPFSRIDLYEINEKEYFGEITLYPASGLGIFKPDQYNEILGKMLTLPDTKRGGVRIVLLPDGIKIESIGLTDYKFYCFDGRVKYCEVISGRYTKKQIDFFDLDWNHEEFTFNGYDFADILPTKPKCFEEMVEVAGKLCKDKPYSRIDLYVVGSKVYFGEITFYPASGFRGFHPNEWNKRLGDFIKLPTQ